jgi:hypothetical protein
VAEGRVRRRKAAAFAGAAAVTAFAATVGLGANLGLFGLAEPQSRTGPAGDRPAAPATAPAVAVPADD